MTPARQTLLQLTPGSTIISVYSPWSQRHSPLYRSQRRVVHYGSVSPCLDFIQYGADDNSLNAAEQRELNSRMEKKQMKEFMTVYSILEPYQILFIAPSSNLWFLTYTQMYSTLVQRCFDHCVNDFTTKSLVSREEGCVMRCVDKYLKSSERLGQRFQEQNAAMMQSGGLPGR